MMDVTVWTNVNGAAREIRVEPDTTLLEALRDELGLTGAKTCCAVGECGACTVHLDGVAVNACLVLAAEADGRIVTTIEGLSAGGLTDLQEEFLNHGAAQCGFCIPGQIMAATGLLEGNPDPTDDEIRTGMAGNLCRCASYQRIIEAIKATAAARRASA